jgi:uncharacterized protein (DUF1697 family)
MARYLALLRGVNVGGVVLKMGDFKRTLEYIGYKNVRTYIQSGNALFESEDSNKRMMESAIGNEVKALVGRDIVVIVKSFEELRRIVGSHPLAELGDPDKLYVTLLAYDPAKEDVEALMETMNDVDRHEVLHRAVYSYYGEGYGKSRRSNNFIEKILKVPATTRNWATMNALYDLASGLNPANPEPPEIESPR